MSKLRIGLIGYGNWARQALVPALRGDPRARIVAAAAPSSATRARIGTELGFEMRVYREFKSLLADGSLDAVLIAVPDHKHENAIQAAIESGLPFFYEPPVADRLDRIYPVLHSLLHAPQVTQADLELRCLPVVQQASQRVATGIIGEPKTALIWLKGSWKPTPDAQISLPHALAAWYLDALDLVLGSHPRRVLVQDGQGTPGRMQTYAITQLDYGEIWGTFSADISSFDTTQTGIEVSGREGNLHADLFSGKLHIRTRTKPEWQVESIPARQPYAGWPGMHECVASFLDAITGTGESLAGPSVMARAHLTGLAAEESIDTGTWAAVRNNVGAD